MDNSSTNHTRSKRKSKVHVEAAPPPKPPPPPEDPPPDDNDDEEGGITRCVCGRTDLDADEEDLGLMVMCETCKVWQHGVCVNLPEDVSGDYYCEQCRPDLHVELLKSLKKRSRHSSQHARRHSASVPRSSRSHSPGHVLSNNSNASNKPPKRRNTMNSRDAEYEDAVKQLIESTRPHSDKPTQDNPPGAYDKESIAKFEEPGVIIEIVSGARKKRKRVLDPDKSASNSNGSNSVDIKPDPLPLKNKRTRSNSTTPDHVAPSLNATTPTVQTNNANASINNTTTNSRQQNNTTTTSTTKPNATGSGKSRRSKKEQTTVDVDGSKKHPNQYTYRKPAAPTPPRRPGVNGHPTSNGNGPPSSEQGGNGGNAPGPSSSTGGSGNGSGGTAGSGGNGGGGGNAGGGSTSRRGGGGHSLHHPPLTPQQPLLTSWGLPDYLTHLASELPTEVPRPVYVRVLDPSTEQSRTADTGATVTGGTTNTTEPNNALPGAVQVPPLPMEDAHVLERGVKVKWPAKRTSVSDMNKRVRGIIDWVGREQAAALERRRRREALRRALVIQQQQQAPSSVDDVEVANTDVLLNEPEVTLSKLGDISSPPESEATHLMEELMKELIAFQEKFGPGAGTSSGLFGSGVGITTGGGVSGGTSLKMKEGRVRG